MLNPVKQPAWASLSILCILCAYGYISYISHVKPENSLLIFLCLSFAVFFAVFLLHKNIELGRKRIFFWAVIFHTIGFFGLPLFEDDHYRYLWDGYQSIVNGSPYGVAPEAFFTDTTIPANMQMVLSGINNPEVPTIYGPILEAIFAAAYLIAPAKLWPIKLTVILTNLGFIFLLLKHASPKQVMLYAWNPLVFKEIALTAHPDGLLALLIFSAWLSRHYWQGKASSIIFGIAMAIKISALPVFAWLFWKRQYLAIVLSVCMFLVCYLPFLGTSSDWEGLKIFAKEWEFNAGLYALAKMIFSDGAAKLFCMLLAGMAMLYVMKGKQAEENPPWHTLFGILLLCSPVVNAWYLLWFLGLAVLHPQRWPWWASMALLLSYVTGKNLKDETMPAYAMPIYIQMIEWLIIFIAIFFDVYRAKKTNLSASSQPLLHDTHSKGTL